MSESYLDKNQKNLWGKKTKKETLMEKQKLKKRNTIWHFLFSSMKIYMNYERRKKCWVIVGGEKRRFKRNGLFLCIANCTLNKRKEVFLNGFI